MLITSTWGVDIFIFLSTIIMFIVYKYSTRHYDYFKRRSIRYEKPIPFFGSMFSVISAKQTIGEWLRDLYNTIDAPYFGIFVFDDPYIIIKSPQLIKHILVKDFNMFSDRTVLAPKHDEIVSNMLFFQKSPEWKKNRSKITPAFTSGKLKGMFSAIYEIGEELNSYIQKNLGNMEAKELSAKYSTDVIAKCAFAINSHSFTEKNPEFRQIGKSLFDFTWRNGFVQSTCFFKPSWANLLRLHFFDKWSIDLLKNIFWTTIRKREEINARGNDIIDLLVEIRKDKKLCDELKFYGDKVVSQAITFFAAGFETTSSAISYTLYELCLHPEIQDKLRREIMSNINEYNGITYEGLQKMKYLDMCVFETLRKYPVLPFLDRRCNEDYKVPGTDLTIEKGMAIYIPLLGLHYDEQYFPEPEKYDPERFNDKNSYNTDGLCYMPFGEGPRICIGERFGLLVVKLALAQILSKFMVERISETPMPIKFAAKSFILQSTVGLPMKFKDIEPTAA